MDPSTLIMPSATIPIPSVDAALRRAERRVAHRVPCRVRSFNSALGKPVSVVGQTVNLSANGLAVQIGRPIEEGTSVEVLLPHLDGEPTRLCGRVAHSRRVLSGTFEVGIWIEPESTSS